MHCANYTKTSFVHCELSHVFAHNQNNDTSVAPVFKNACVYVRFYMVCIIYMHGRAARVICMSPHTPENVCVRLFPLDPQIKIVHLSVRSIK